MNAGLKAQRIKLMTAGAVLLAIAYVTAVLVIPRIQRASLVKDLTRAVHIFRIGYASHIALADFTDFEWDRAYIFAPYTSRDEVLAKLGMDWTGVNDSTISTSDSAALLVFVKGERVVRWVEMPRAESDYASVTLESPFTPETARFILPFEDQPVLVVLR